MATACGLVGSVPALGKATPVAFPTPSYVATPSALDVTTANAPSAMVDGGGVSLFSPLGSDNQLKGGMAIVPIEPSSLFAGQGQKSTASTVSCASSDATGIVACSHWSGSAFEMPKLPLLKLAGIATHQVKKIHFTGGDCANCGVAIDDGLGIAIFSTANGYVPVALATRKAFSLISTNGEAISGNFGYDPVDHLILSPNYKVTNFTSFTTDGMPHFQIVTLTDGVPQLFDLASDQSFFYPGSGTCTGSDGSLHSRDTLPDSGAIDTSTAIAYVTFRSPSACSDGNQTEDVALFDLTQATFTPGSPSGTWNTPAKAIQTLSGMTDFVNGITGIAVVSVAHLAFIADRHEEEVPATNTFGAIQLPASSGGATPVIQDWVEATMPSPGTSGIAWSNAFEPNGLTAYMSPSIGKAYGVLINQARTYAAIVDLAALLGAPRAVGQPHALSSAVDLTTSGIVTFLPLTPVKAAK